MKRVEVRGYTREGGKEFVNSYSRNDSRVVQAAFAAMRAVKERQGEQPVLKSLSSEALKATPSHLTAEIMAVAAYEPNNTILPGGYTPTETITDSRTGMAVTVFTAPGKKSVIAFRGTEGNKMDARDIMTDIDPRGVGFSQFEGNRDKLAAIAAKYPGATVTGHSLGGALAQRYAAEFGNAAGEVITFNSPGIDKITAAKFKGGKKATHYVADGDPVSLGGEQFINGTAKVVSFKSGKTPVVGNTLDKHLSIVNAGLLGNSSATVKTISSAELSNPNFRYGSARATGGLSRGFVENGRKGVGAIASPLQPVVALAGAALGKFGIGVS